MRVKGLVVLHLPLPSFAACVGAYARYLQNLPANLRLLRPRLLPNVDQLLTHMYGREHGVEDGSWRRTMAPV